MEAVNGKIEQLLSELSQEGLLNEQFQQLMQLQDESNPDFVKEVVELYFQDSASKLEKLSSKLYNPHPDFGEVDALVHQFKGSSASFGAQAIAQQCVKMREACHAHDAKKCQKLLEEASQIYSLLHKRLETFLQLETQKKQIQASHQ